VNVPALESPRLSQTETSRWLAFLEAWWQAMASDFVLVETLFSGLAGWLPAEYSGSGNERSRKTRFGKALGRLRGHQVGAFFIEAVRQDHRGRQEYRLHQMTGAEVADLSVARTADLADLSVIQRSSNLADLAKTSEPTLPADFAEVADLNATLLAEVADVADLAKTSEPTLLADFAEIADLDADLLAEVAEVADFPRAPGPTSPADFAEVADLDSSRPADIADFVEVMDLPPASPTSTGLVSLERYEAAVLRLGWIEGQLDMTRRMLTDGGQREAELQRQLEQEAQARLQAQEEAQQLQQRLEEERCQRLSLEERLKPWWRRLLGMK
jgi:hypothetical protein